MIVKKSLKSVMPNLKRCRVGDDEELAANRKKRKLAAGYFPLHLLGEAAAGIIPCKGYGIEKLISKSEEAVADVTESRRAEPESKEVSREVQVLSSQFNDSVLDDWKKEKSISKNDGDEEYVSGKENDNKFSFKSLSINCGKRNEKSINLTHNLCHATESYRLLKTRVIDNLHVTTFDREI